jgi:pimeloyl-ACP methyl ester carboxylesterase
VLLLVLAATVPGIRAGVKAPGVLAEAIEQAWPRPLAPEVTRQVTEVGGVAGERYAAIRSGPPLLLVPGATPAGLDDARTIRLARSLARAGRDVFVPVLDLFDQVIGTDDVDRVVAAGVALADAAPDGTIVLVGVSYGGATALLAAADPDLRDRIARVAVFGAYWDMLGVVQAAATGESLVGDRRIPWAADPRAPELLTEQILARAPASEAEQVAAVLAGNGDAAALSDGAAALVELVRHTDPAQTAGIAARLPPDVRAELAAISPSSVAEDIRAPVIVLHDIDDPAVPFGEALRLQRDLPRATVLAVELFDHVDLDTDRSRLAIAGDLWRTWRFGRAVLAPQERPLGSLTP